MKKEKMLLLLLLILAGSLVLSGCAGTAALNNAVSWPGLSTDGEIVYVAYGSSVQALSEGKVLWKYPVEAEKSLMFFAAPTIGEDRIYAGTYSNEVHVLNKENGSLISKIVLTSNKSKILASPTLSGEMLYVPSSNGTIYAFDTQNLNVEKWREKLTNEVWSSPLQINGDLIVFSLDKKLNVLDAETGEIKGVHDVNGAVMSEPVMNGEKLYFTTFEKEVNSYDPESGEIKALFTAGSEIWASPLIVEDSIIIADMSGNVYCHDLATGDSKWSLTNVTGEGKGIIANPVLLGNDNILISTENGDLLVYDLDGKSVNTRSTKSKLMTTPLVNNDSVILATIPGDALLRSYTFDLKENWVYLEVAPTEAESSDSKTTATPAE